MENYKNDAADLSRKFFFITPNVLIDKMGTLRITPTEFTLIMVITRHAFQKDSSWPSLRLIEQKTNLTRPTIIKNLKSLEKKGYIIKTSRKRDDNGQYNNLYSFKPLNDILEKNILSNDDPRLNYLTAPVKKFNPNKNNKNKNKIHTQGSNSSLLNSANYEKTVCEIDEKKQNETAKEIKAMDIFRPVKEEIILRLTSEYGAEVKKAARYIHAEFKNLPINNPAGLLIKTLRSGMYAEIQSEENKNPNISAEIEQLNVRYGGRNIFGKEKITEIFNIGGMAAFRTDNLLRESVITSAKNVQEFEKYLSRIKQTDTS